MGGQIHNQQKNRVEHHQSQRHRLISQRVNDIGGDLAGLLDGARAHVTLAAWLLALSVLISGFWRDAGITARGKPGVSLPAAG
jgi:hypothetical protein